MNREQWTAALSAALEAARNASPLSGIFTTVKRAVLLHMGACNPVGIGNSKTQTVNIYSPVGKTCPSSCPYMEQKGLTTRGELAKVPLCLALAGKVNLQQRRATEDPEDRARTAAVGFICAYMTGTPARLEVSGDAGQTWEDARRYHELLTWTLQHLQTLPDCPRHLGWRYTHLPRTREGLRTVAALHSLGLATRWSDFAGPGGAVVGDFKTETLQKLRALGARPVKCIEQMDKRTSCAECRLCWERPELTILFKPSGGRYVDFLSKYGASQWKTEEVTA